MGGKNRERMLIIGALACLLLLAGERLIVRPLVGPWTARSERIDKLEQDLAAGQLLLDRRASITQQWKEMQERDLPKSHDLAQVQMLQAVQAWAGESNLTYRLTPRWELVNSKEKDAGELLQLRMSASGDMRSIGRFLNVMESSPMALRLERVELKSKNERGSQLDLEATFTGLVLPEVES